MTAYWTAPDGNGDDTIWTGDPEHPIAVVRRCDLAVPAACDPDGLACTRDDGHPDGHVFHGSWCADAERDEE